MKIKLALLERDQNYLDRIVMVFSTKYADKFEIYSFTNRDVALSTLNSVRIDVLVASDAFDIDVDVLPKRCGFAYFVDSTSVDTYNDQRAICKFQKVDLIYKQILSIYSENAGSISGLKHDDDSCKVIAFTSPSGGVGSSSMAAACALHFSSQGNKTLYLNLEKFGSSDVFFAAEGQFDMSDIIFALKRRKANLSMKLESCVKQDPRGVYFYSQSKIALDMLELSTEEMIRLISEVKRSGSYNYIVLDINFSINKETLKLLYQVHSIIWIGDGSEISNLKTVRAYKALLTMEQYEDLTLTSRLILIYNKFSNKTSKTVGIEEIKSIGGVPRYEHATTEQVLSQLSVMEIFDRINERRVSDEF